MRFKEDKSIPQWIQGITYLKYHLVFNKGWEQKGKPIQEVAFVMEMPLQAYSSKQATSYAWVMIFIIYPQWEISYATWFVKSINF